MAKPDVEEMGVTATGGTITVRAALVVSGDSSLFFTGLISSFKAWK